MGIIKETGNTRNKQETPLSNSDTLQTLKATHVQMGLLAKRLGNINSWREEVDVALTKGDPISLTAGVPK